MEGINKPTHYVNMPLIQALQDSTAMTCIHRSKLPSEQDFDQYHIEIVVEEYSNEEDEKAEVCFMEFIHRTTGQVFRVNIVDVGKSLNAFHFLNWHCDRNNRKGNFDLGDSIGVSLSLNCMDYFKPENKVYWMSSFREEALEKLVSLEPIDEEIPSAQ